MSEPSPPQSDHTPAAGSVDCATATEPVPVGVETDVQAVDTHLPEPAPALPRPPPEPRVIAAKEKVSGRIALAEGKLGEAVEQLETLSADETLPQKEKVLIPLKRGQVYRKMAAVEPDREKKTE